MSSFYLSNKPAERPVFATMSPSGSGPNRTKNGNLLNLLQHLVNCVSQRHQLSLHHILDNIAVDAEHEDEPLVCKPGRFIHGTRLNHGSEKIATSCSASLALCRNGQENDRPEPIVFFYNVRMAETQLRTKLFVPQLHGTHHSIDCQADQSARLVT